MSAEDIEEVHEALAAVAARSSDCVVVLHTMKPRRR